MDKTGISLLLSITPPLAQGSISFLPYPPWHQSVNHHSGRICAPNSPTSPVLNRFTKTHSDFRVCNHKSRVTIY
ncbi:hypothetical protein B9Z19DRAFT_1083096, partial [Tuber borchii]